MNEGSAPDEFLRLLVEHRDDVLAHLDEASRDRLVDLMARAEDEPLDTLADLEDLVLDAVPVDHPLVQHLANRMMLQATAEPTDLSWLARNLGSVGEALLGRPMAASMPPGPPPTPGGARDLLAEVRRRLVALPAYRPEEVAEVDAHRDLLIQLRAPGGAVRLPRFQFSADSRRPREVVLTVNRLLDAAVDPWGATSWWVSPHALLDGAPVDLLGSAREQVLPILAGRVGVDW